MLNLRKEHVGQINSEYVSPVSLDTASAKELKKLILDYHKHTGSTVAEGYLTNWEEEKAGFVKLIPKGVLEMQQALADLEKATKEVGEE